MILKIDEKYPALSALVFSQSNKQYDLHKLGKGGGNLRDGYLNLGYCCYVVINNLQKWPAGDPYNYLGTLNEFIRRLTNDPYACKKIYNKLISSSGSVFLDTVAEASWAVHFWNSGLDPTIEKPFIPENSRSKNADLVISLNGVEHWLDVLNIDSSNKGLSSVKQEIPIFGRPSAEVLLPELAERAKRKYDRKFKRAVETGLLNAAYVGVLLCIMKLEKYYIPSFLPALDEGINYPPPARLFSKQTPRLNLVWVHTLRPGKDSDVLQPVSIFKWVNNQF